LLFDYVLLKSITVYFEGGKAREFCSDFLLNVAQPLFEFANRLLCVGKTRL